jgi:hypothetical protein
MILVKDVTTSATTYHFHKEDRPRGSAYDALAIILALDSIKFDVDKLADVSDERKNFTDATIHGGHGSEDID